MPAFSFYIIEFRGRFHKLCRSFPPYAQLLRYKKASQKFGVERKQFGVGCKTVNEMSPGLIIQFCFSMPRRYVVDRWFWRCRRTRWWREVPRDEGQARSSTATTWPTRTTDQQREGEQIRSSLLGQFWTRFVESNFNHRGYLNVDETQILQ